MGKILQSEVVDFFSNQGYAVVSTLDQKGSIHNSCKGIVDIDAGGRLYLLDLYQGRTYLNLQENKRISVVAVEEHHFKGYCLKGKAKIIPAGKLPARIIEAWEAKLSSRITRRLLRNLREEKGHPKHPEALLPKPEYMIAMDIEEIIDLTPGHLKLEVLDGKHLRGK